MENHLFKQMNDMDPAEMRRVVNVLSTAYLIRKNDRFPTDIELANEINRREKWIEQRFNQQLGQSGYLRALKDIWSDPPADLIANNNRKEIYFRLLFRAFCAIRSSDNLPYAQSVADLFHNVPAKIGREWNADTDTSLLEELYSSAASLGLSDQLGWWMEATENELDERMA